LLAVTVDLSDYAKCLQDAAGEHRQVLEASYTEASRVMSPRGLENYLQGLTALSGLGRGQDLVRTYLQEMPAVVKEVGEDILVDCVQACMRLASLTSGAVLTLVLGSLPLAARRLGDADLLRQYLNLIHQLAAKAPRGLRPMLENLDRLLSVLTLGGLRRWALWGVQAHQRDFEGQLAYFALCSESSQAVLQKERRGTLFVDSQRRLNFYLRALWGRSFFLRPTAGDYETRQGLRPFIEHHQIHLPDAFDDYHGLSGQIMYRAAAAHCASHLVYTRGALRADPSPSECQPFVELFEDARVEQLASRAFPGLVRIWADVWHAHDSEEVGAAGEPVATLLRAVATALLPGSPIVGLAPGVTLLLRDFKRAIEDSAESQGPVVQAGLALYRLVRESGPLPPQRVLGAWAAPYRDDNRFVWNFDHGDFLAQESHYLPFRQRQVRRQASVMEMVNELDCEFAGDDAQEIWVLPTVFHRDGDPEGVSINQLEGKEPISDPYHYDEWDYQAQLYRPDWTTVIERRQPGGPPALMDDLLQRQRPIASRIRYYIDALQPRGVVRRRGYEDGEDIDLDAAVRAMLDIRRGVTPNPRIGIRITRHLRDLAVLVLMDLSESTNEPVRGSDSARQTVLDLTREAAGLLAWAIASIGDAFALHGFASDGRHDVQYFRFKDFDEDYGERAKARLAGMRGGLSTRMGAALRHAGSHIGRQTARRKLVLLVTDGEPADIDERDPQYLRHDARKAVEDLARRGIDTFCLTLDAAADDYVARIFGVNRYAIVDRVERLPERLPAVFAAITG
jgi:hypothetical protein